MQTVKATIFTAIDFESTGSCRSEADQPIQVGLAQWSYNQGFTEQFDSYIQSDRPITKQAQDVHRISDATISQSPNFISLWPKLRSFLSGNVVVAHGKGTEQRFLRTFPAHGFGPWIDTLLLYRAAFPDLSDFSLGSLCKHFNLEEKVRQLCPERTWHDALFDAIASLCLLEQLVSQFDLENTPITALIRPSTAVWHAKRRS